MDWTECPLIEEVPGKMSGRPVIKGTRVQPETIVDNFEGGSSIEESTKTIPTFPWTQFAKSSNSITAIS